METEFNEEEGDFQVFIDEGEPNPLADQSVDLTEGEFFEKILKEFEQDEHIDVTLEMMGAGCFLVDFTVKDDQREFVARRMAWVNPDSGILSGRSEEIITFEDEDTYQVGLYTGYDMEDPPPRGQHLLIEGFDNMVAKVREWLPTGQKTTQSDVVEFFSQAFDGVTFNREGIVFQFENTGGGCYVFQFAHADDTEWHEEQLYVWVTPWTDVFDGYPDSVIDFGDEDHTYNVGRYIGEEAWTGDGSYSKVTGLENVVTEIRKWIYLGK